MSSEKPLVLVVGATGNTGKSIVDGLLDAGNFRVAALVRPASQGKPATQELRDLGVEIRLGDVLDSVEKLKEALSGIDIVVSAVVSAHILRQKDLIRAAKEVGVKRFVPCDFGTPGKRGVRALHDEKLDIREFIIDLGVPHTFIDVGWWLQLSVPLPTRSKAPDAIKALTRTLYGAGDRTMLVTDLRHIGAWVARIVADPRTLGRAVIAWEDAVTEAAAHEAGERASGEAEALRAKSTHVSEEETLKLVEEVRADVARDPTNDFAIMKQIFLEHVYSIYILGEDTLETAKALGYLDARELYPDVRAHSLEEFVEEYYALEEPGEQYLR